MATPPTIEPVPAETMVTPATPPVTTQEEKYATYRAGLIQSIRDARAKWGATPTTLPVIPPATTTPAQPVTDQNTIDSATGKPVWEAPIVPEATVVPTVPTATNPVPEQPTPTPAQPTPVSTTPPVPTQPQSFDEAFKILQAGGELADTRNNSLFKSLYSQYNQYSNLDNKTLGSYISDGKVGTNFTNLLARFNPSKYAEVMKVANEATVVNDINTNASNLFNTVNWTPKTEVVKTSDQMMQDLVDGIEKVDKKYSDVVAEAYAANPQIKEKADKIAVLDDKIENIDIEVDKIAETYRTQYPDVPQAMLMGMVNRAAYGLTQERNALVRENKLLYAQYKEEKEQIDKGIEYDIAQEEKIEKRKFDLYGIVRWEEIRQEDFARADQKLADEIARTDKKDKEALDRLETERLDNVKEAISKLWVTPTGETYDDLLGEYATAVKNQPIDNKPFSVGKDSYVFDPKTGTYILPPWATWTAPAPSRKPTIQSSYTPEGTFKVDIVEGATPRKSTRGYYECAMLVNDALGTAMPDLHEDKLKYKNSDEPVVGGAFIEKTNDKYGHTGIVESINANGTLNIVETNYPLGSGVTRKTIDPSKRNIVGYYDPQATSQEPISDKQYTQYNQAFSKFSQEPIVKAFEGAMVSGWDLIASLKSENWPWDVGAVFQFMKTLDPASTVREGEFALAAKSAGVWEQFKNIPANKLEGTILTEEQRKAFGKLALEYVKNKAKMYDVKYNDLTRILWNQKIPESYYPTKMSNFVNELTWDWETAPKKDIDEADLLDAQNQVFELKAQWKTKAEIAKALMAEWLDPLMFNY